MHRFSLYLLIMFSICISNQIHAQNSKMKAYIASPKLEKISITTGDQFDAVIGILPYYRKDKYIFDQLEGTRLFDTFYITKVSKIEFSQNNQDVLEIFLTLIPTKKFDPKATYTWKYQNLTLPVTFKKVNVIKSSLRPEKFYLATQAGSLPTEPFNFLYLLPILLLFLVAFPIQKLREKKRLAKKELAQKQQIIKEWESIFSQASSRPQYEQIFAQKRDWQEYTTSTTPAIDDFLNLMYHHQYKKEWDTNTQLEISDAFDSIKNLFGEQQ